MAFMVLIDKSTRALDDGKFVVGILLDFSKAFDTVDHDILLTKLSHYDIRGVPLLWFQSFFYQIDGILLHTMAFPLQ